MESNAPAVVAWLPKHRKLLLWFVAAFFMGLLTGVVRVWAQQWLYDSAWILVQN